MRIYKKHIQMVVRTRERERERTSMPRNTEFPVQGLGLGRLQEGETVAEARGGGEQR